MHLVATRKYAFIATQTLAECQARDSLFRFAENKFLLHMTSDEDLEDERLVWLDTRAALLWINQTTDEYGINWE
ncbi:hypothetical protein [Bradyrhizobium sp. AZCC 2230]|uniref:hypothetical protein n=1 Tax=Bradyrhizobium sp. AZCC 2230 TaxID=3117021 RepID=UPI002FF2754B